jgi:hypothetical protein
MGVEVDGNECPSPHGVRAMPTDAIRHRVPVLASRPKTMRLSPPYPTRLSGARKPATGPRYGPLCPRQLFRSGRQLFFEASSTNPTPLGVIRSDRNRWTGTTRLRTRLWIEWLCASYSARTNPEARNGPLK